MLLQRQSELNLAAAALRRTAGGQGASLLISGPPGIGKSSLLSEIGELCVRRDVLVLRAHAAPMEQDFTFGVIRQMLEPALMLASCGQLHGWMSDAAGSALSVFRGDPSDPESGDAAVRGGLLSLTRNMSEDRVLVLLVDDLHWADEASLSWLDQLVRQLPRSRMLLVCTLCEGEPSAEQPAVRRITARVDSTLLPAPLDPLATRSLLRRSFARPVEPEFAAEFHRISRGNPLHLMSMLHECRTRGVAPTAAEAPVVASLRPAALKRRILLSLENQQPAAVAMARALALLDDQSDRDLAGRLAGLDAVDRDESLRQLHRLDVVTGGGRLRFTHPVVRGVVQDATPSAERDRLHLRAAELLQAQGRPAEQVASHLLSATAHLGTWAVSALRSAADTALRRGAPQTAARYLRRALLDRPPHDVARARLLVELATAERSFALSIAVRRISQAIPLLPSAQERAEAVTKLTPVAFAETLLPVDGLIRQVAEDLGPLEGLRGTKRELALRLEARLRSASTWDPEQLSGAVPRLEELGPHPDLSGSAGRELLAALLHSATITIGVPAERVARLAHRILEHEPASSAHVHTALPYVVSSLVAADSVDGVLPWLETALTEAVRQGGRVEQSIVLSEQAVVLLAQGRIEKARTQALKAAAVVGSEEPTTASAIVLALTALHTRELSLVDELVSTPRSWQHNRYLSAVLTMIRGAEAAMRQDHPTALEYFLDTRHDMERAGWRNPAQLPWASWAVPSLLELGERRRADQLSRQELEMARSWGAPSAVGQALVLRGKVVGGAVGITLLREAVEVLEGSANRFALSKALLCLGERLMPRATVESVAALRRSYELAVECGVLWISSRAGALLGSAAPSAVPTQLTSAERKVAEMAVSGLTNQAIADALGVSRRAVEKHLTNCYRKMSTTGRAGLASALENDRGKGGAVRLGQSPPHEEGHPVGPSGYAAVSQLHGEE
ncbi:helix-turn-helix transcriptional regulator [Wenjunlia tyrosinilytica]|uniref:HTH luxR-type domain-containing protein n=1 Tax=Wenjunlia tyrosinilytica TaxID=1544741 RepID=A0A917ZWF1_9ACTN|nr:LuxR family transcriptional regulator [Wenjunlia tyrosinilytica]GGO97785.1 hypothetical protein GCM10012280_60390 [Wenjunlia tyrosinilytica]